MSTDSTRGIIKDSVAVEAQQLAAARAKRHPSKHEVKIPGKKFSGKSMHGKRK